MMKAKQAALNEEKKQSEREKLIDKKIKAS